MVSDFFRDAEIGREIRPVAVLGERICIRRLQYKVSKLLIQL